MELRGTPVSSQIVPWDDRDTFPTHVAKYGKGGFRSVETLEKLDEITIYRREFGMFVYVRSNNTVYVYKKENEETEGDDVEQIPGIWVPWSGGGDSVYQVHEFPDPLNEWDIPHYLGMFPSVTTIDQDSERIFGEVKYIDSNNIKISFSDPVSGKAFLN